VKMCYFLLHDFSHFLRLYIFFIILGSHQNREEGKERSYIFLASIHAQC
jgi:hypothetical protein